MPGPSLLPRYRTELRLDVRHADRADCDASAEQLSRGGQLEVHTPHAFAPGERLVLSLSHPEKTAAWEHWVEVVPSAEHTEGVTLRSLRVLSAPDGPPAAKGAIPVHRVLLVEDNPHIVQMYVHALHRAFPSHEAEIIAESVGNGLEALSRLRSGSKVDLILTDIYMPVMDGFTFLERLRADPALAHTPVAVITAEEDARARAEKLGVQAYLGKPVQLNAIVEVVRSLLGGGR